MTAKPASAFQDTSADLVSCGSLEMNADRAADARVIAEWLPAGTKVYVNHLPRNTLAETLQALDALRDAGLEPVPHLAARRVPSRDALTGFLERAVRNAGVQRVLLIGGDEPRALGPYADGLVPLADGSLAAAGIREVGLAGYPEGHARIPRAELERSMQDKLAAARRHGLSAYIVTQFSFAPTRVVEYCAELALRHAGVPIYVGIAGPTDPIKLLRYAQRCGVSASLRALRAQGLGAARLVTHTDPGEQVTALAHYCAQRAACNVVGVHMFSFGGVLETARWMNRHVAGQIVST